MKRFLVLFLMIAVLGSLFMDVAPAGQTGAAPTTLRLEATGEAADGTVTRGQKITLAGTLKSTERPGCKKRKTIKLFIDGNGPFASTVTTRRGRYRFSIPGPHPTKPDPHKFQAKFAGTRYCKADESNVVNVTVSP